MTLRWGNSFKRKNSSFPLVAVLNMKSPFWFSDCFSSSSDLNTDDGSNDENFRLFTRNELKSATHNFRSSNKVGQGGFGAVYKGRLQNGTIVAVKTLSIEMESMRGEREFIAELSALSSVRHENLVRLRGCCVDGANRYLVYDYMENNSLTHTLLGVDANRQKFNWETRKEISIGVARAIAYLHEEVNPHIVHRDIKASNILLDQNFRPKVADFGLSKLLRDNSSYISTKVAGTLGYLAPEYAISGHLTRKSDVYSYGVLLLEIVSGRGVVDFDIEHGEHYLVQKAWEAFKANNLLQLVDPILGPNFSTKEALRFLKMGLRCVQETTRQRPTMSTVVKILSNEEDEIEDDKISEPGMVADYMDIKMGVGDKRSSHSISSKGSTSNSV